MGNWNDYNYEWKGLVYRGCNYIDSSRIFFPHFDFSENQQYQRIELSAGEKVDFDTGKSKGIYEYQITMYYENTSSGPLYNVLTLNGDTINLEYGRNASSFDLMHITTQQQQSYINAATWKFTLNRSSSVTESDIGLIDEFDYFKTSPYDTVIGAPLYLYGESRTASSDMKERRFLKFYYGEDSSRQKQYLDVSSKGTTLQINWINEKRIVMDLTSPSISTYTKDFYFRYYQLGKEDDTYLQTSWSGSGLTATLNFKYYTKTSTSSTFYRDLFNITPYGIEINNVRGNNGFLIYTSSKTNEQGLRITSTAIYKNLSTQTMSLGTSTNLFSVVYATNGTIQTSDETKKDIISIDDRYEKLFLSLEPILYKWKNEDDNAEHLHDRIHCGLGAQTTKKHMDEVGITPEEYALYCEDTIEDKDNNDELTGTTHKEYGINYGQLHGMEVYMIQKLYKENKELKARLDALESRLG